MSLFGSLSTSVSALNVQSQAIAMTANNIANVSTIGYKRKEASFSSIVTSDSRNARYSPGSVRVQTIQKVDGQGGLQQTTAQTDIAVSGQGFFVVQKSSEGLQEKFYTRAGAFSEDASGFLRNTAGFYLMGWPLAADGALPAGLDDLSSLTPVDVAFLGGLTRPTQNATLSLNLDSSEEIEAFPISTTAASDFARSIRVYDSLGAGQDLSLEFTHHDSPTDFSILGNSVSAFTATDQLTNTPGVTAGDQFTVTVGSTAVTITIGATTTFQDVLNTLNQNSGFSAVGLAEMTTTGDLRVIAKQPSTSVVIANVGLNTSATALGLQNAAAPTLPNLLLTPAGTYNPKGWWQVSVKNAVSGEVLQKGSINFDSNGAINSVRDSDDEIKFAVDNVNWNNGSSPQDLNIRIANLSQFSGTYNVISTTQDGSELGLRTGVEIDRTGKVVARFSNGQTSAIYQLPLATFTNPNGMSEVTGNAYSQTVDSGSFNLKQAGQGGSGFIEGSSLESSNVDIADEFTKMIVIQRAYSAGTKVIRTVDEMTEELLRLK